MHTVIKLTLCSVIWYTNWCGMMQDESNAELRCQSRHLSDPTKDIDSREPPGVDHEPARNLI